MPADAGTKTLILDAADAVFRRRGTAGARMQEIADEAGVNKALLHYHFRSKDRLAAAAFERAGRRLLPPILDTLASDLPIREKVSRVVHHELETLASAPELPGYLLSEMHHHPERIEKLIATITASSPRDFGPTILASLGEQLDAAARRGEMRPIRPEQFITYLVALCVFPFAARPLVTAALGENADPNRNTARRADELVEFFLAGLRP